jgi:hypothetical protein
MLWEQKESTGEKLKQLQMTTFGCRTLAIKNK